MPPPDEIDFKLIQHVQQKESHSHGLTKLPADFFDGLSEHIDALRALAREEVARDPMSTRATLVQNELRSTLRLAHEIVTLRLRKMANRTVDALEGGKVDLRSLTPREKDIYEEMARSMARARDALLPSEGRAKGAGEAGVATPAPAVAPAVLGEESAEEARGEAQAPEAEEAPGTVPEAGGSVVVHLTADTPPFIGEGGEEYSLKKGDIVNLSRRLADVLIGRGVAEEVDVASQGEG